MYSIGVDIIEIERIQKVVARWGERFLYRVYTSTELEDCRGRTPALAARFAAKEAAAKALGTGLGEIYWQEIEIRPDPYSKPLLHLHGKARARAEALGLRHFALSLSHSRDYALAFVVAWG